MFAMDIFGYQLMDSNDMDKDYPQSQLSTEKDRTIVSYSLLTSEAVVTSEIITEVELFINFKMQFIKFPRKFH